MKFIPAQPLLFALYFRIVHGLLNRPIHMNLPVFLTILFALTGFSKPVPKPTRVLVGTPPVPVVSGEVWLIANRWGAYPGILVATIRVENPRFHA